MNNTKIICTIGPACDNETRLRELMLAGMNVVRFNFSHGTHEQQKQRFEMVDRLRKELGMPITTLLDTKGPEIRLRDFAGNEAELEAGQEFVLTKDDILGTKERAAITYESLYLDVKAGNDILIDDGLIAMKVERILGTDIVCRVLNGGRVSNHKGVNVPGTVLSMPFINQTDRADIEFGIKLGFDFLAASFVRTAEDVKEIREILKAHQSKMQTIAKIESTQGVENLEAILDVADGIMVARGDLGVEVPIEEVPALQKTMIRSAVAKGKHVITATQMLESMIHNPRPTRAEATDIANAIYDGTTAIMLSGETAAGNYPVVAVETMARIACNTEADINYYHRLMLRSGEEQFDVTRSIAFATCSIAMELHAKAIITVTMTGFTAQQIAKYKPGCPIIGCTIEENAYYQMNMLWGVHSLRIPREANVEALFGEAISSAKRAGYITAGDVIVITAGLPLGMTGKTNMIRVVDVE